MGLRYWAWSTMTAHGRALVAYERGLDTFEVTLEVLLPGYTSTVDNITSIGWRLDDTFVHPRVKTTKVTPRSDGTHRVIRTQSQKTTFYFVRDDPHPKQPAEQISSSPTWPAGWYETDRGWHWWDGAQYTQPHAAPPQQPQSQVYVGMAMAGMSNGEHVLHLMLTLFSCGLWAPGWILLARKRRRVGPNQ